MERTLIKIVDICRSHKIETHFIRNLSESGLLQLIVQQDEEFVDEEELGLLEQFVTWHYELELNIQGIEVAHSLLLKIKNLQNRLDKIERGLIDKEG